MAGYGGKAQNPAVRNSLRAFSKIASLLSIILQTSEPSRLRFGAFGSVFVGVAGAVQRVKFDARSALKVSIVAGIEPEMTLLGVPLGREWFEQTFGIE